MKTAVILMMLTALYLLYRIAFPKRQEAKQGNNTPQRDETDPLEVVGKSRFVMPDRSKPLQTPASDADNETEEENALTFAAGNEKREAVIPSEKLDEVFGEASKTESELPDEINLDELDIEPDENETAADDEPDVDGEEEAEELRQTLGRDAQPAGGWSVEEMEAAVEATHNPTDEKADILLSVEKTDLFEKLVSGDEGKESRIRAIIERHVRKLYPEEEGSKSNLENFDVAEFLS